MIFDKVGAATSSAYNLRILVDKQSRSVSLLVSKDFNASVRLDMLLNGILNWLLTKSFSFYKSQFSALEDVSRDV